MQTSLCDLFACNVFVPVTLIPSLACIFTFFATCLGFDLVAWLWPKLRIQNVSESDAKIREMIHLSIRNLFAGLGVVVLLHPLTATIMYTGPFTWLYQSGVFIVMMLLADGNFYWSHRLLHHPLFYARCHKLHHSCKHPVPWTSLYVDVGEFVIAIMSSFLLPLWMVGALGLSTHYLTYSAYLIFLTFSLVMSHDGMNIPFLDATHHDEHHLRFTGNYGTKSMMWDRLMGTVI